MKISDEIEATLERVERSLPDQEALVRLREFFLEMQRLGIAKASSYNLPPLDTLSVPSVKSQAEERTGA